MENTRQESVVITMVVDESGSMARLRDSTIEGFNGYVDTVARELPDTRTWFSAIKFNTSGIARIQVGARIREAIRLSKENYHPDDGTPLLDAVGQAILATDKVMAEQHGTKAIVVIQTDGEENASIKYTLTDIKALIESRQAKGWQFVFIGAGIDAFADAQKLGINQLNTMSYGATNHHTSAVFASAAANTARYFSGLAANTNFNAEQEASAGEPGIIRARKAKLRNEQRSSDVDLSEAG